LPVALQIPAPKEEPDKPGPKLDKAPDTLRMPREDIAPGLPGYEFKITLDQAAELGMINSREFQSAREDLYLAALPVTLQRFAFPTQFFATEQATRNWMGRLFPGGPKSDWEFDSNVGFHKLFSTGALLLVSFANQTVLDLSGTAPRRTISQST